MQRTEEGVLCGPRVMDDLEGELEHFLNPLGFIPHVHLVRSQKCLERGGKTWTVAGRTF